MNSGTLGNDGAVADGATGLVQSITENSQENDWCDNTLEAKEVLDLGDISRVLESGLIPLGSSLPLCRECTGREAGAGSRAKSQSFPLW